MNYGDFYSIAVSGRSSLRVWRQNQADGWRAIGSSLLIDAAGEEAAVNGEDVAVHKTGSPGG